MIVERFLSSKLLKKASWNLVSNVIYALSQWIIIVIITKFGDGKMLGQYSLAFSITAPIILFCGLSLRSYQITDVNKSFTFIEYLTTRKLSNYVSFLIILIVVLVSKYDWETNIIILLVGLNKIIDGLSDIVQGEYQLNDNLEKSAQLKIIKSLVFVFSTVFSFYLFNYFIYILISVTIINFLYYFLVDYRLVKKSSFLDVKRYFFKSKTIILITWTMGLNISLSSLTTNIPRIFIEKYEGLEKLGYFTAISYFMLIGTLFVTALGQATSTNLSKELADGNFKKFEKIIKTNLIFSFSLGIISVLISVLFGKYILYFFYDQKTSEYSFLLVILMFATLFNYLTSPYSYGIISLRIMKKQPLITIISLIIATVLSLILIPKFGVLGGAYIILICSIQQLIMKRNIYIKAITKYKSNSKGVI